MVERTGARVAFEASDETPALRSIERTRAALDEFVGQVVEHLPRTDDVGVRRLLRRIRSVGVHAALFAARSSVQFTTGDEFDVQVSASLEDWVQVEITVPQPWGDAATVDALTCDALAAHLRVTTETALDEEWGAYARGRPGRSRAAG